MERIAVLASGGLDSSILLADLAGTAEVFPIYIRKGLLWEEEEIRSLNAFIEVLRSPNIHGATELYVPVDRLYGEHWSLTGKGTPGADTADDAVFLPGRNVLLVSLAAIWCSTHDVSRIALGSLGGNPFPDATPEFFSNLAGVLSVALGCRISVTAPYRGAQKHDLIRDFKHLPLHLTLTCISPRDGLHCGACNKCNERRIAFKQAEIEDSTKYAGN